MLDGKPILVIEDDEASAFYLEEILAEINLPVITAYTAAEAIEAVKKNNISLILMDIRLPDMDGYELTRQFRKNGFVAPIIAQTAFVLPNDREKALKSGCNDYLPKPLRRELLWEMLNKYLKISLPS